MKSVDSVYLVLATLVACGAIWGGLTKVKQFAKGGPGANALGIAAAANAELQRYNQTLESEIAIVRANLAALKQHSEDQDRELVSLRSLVQGIEAINSLSSKQDTQHAELIALIGGKTP
jgi:hypothetical protein